MNNSLSLSAKRDVALTENTQTVTTKELAEMLGVDVRTVNGTVERLLESTSQNFGEVGIRSFGGRPTKLFTEQQATIIKQKIQRHHNLATRHIDTVTTEQEENQTIANAIMILQRRNNELRQRAAIAENTLSRISDGKGCYSMNQTAKALKLPYGNIKLYERLRKEGILNADNSPRQDQINAGHFKVVAKFINDTVGSKPVTLTTGKGLVYLAKKFNTTIDETIQADAE